ncbi:alpha-amylase family glycosyl hydrolase [Aquimarina gracilis]|uniref:Alpha-amylase family glycosyl hydrolase n=1 Tax=Aquimarina gracilis TaxID=874422 RepID=A0ABU5ZSY3_9FLAO|nr:alpha-amylase family glycosyl hydrolase [Aquimarina gracilis]MEB3345088.1 alpha-amylase family glycosyl hydrolase [Aquimarina gracilis]
MKKTYIILCCFIVLIMSCTKKTKEKVQVTEQRSEIAYSNPEAEVFYHVFQRSFYDTNGDGHGDLNGVTQKIDYLKDLGVTSLLFTPLYKSIYYHNYFPDDFKAIDEEFGTLDDYLNMVKKLHENDMKFYMDMEIHYVTKNHPWFKDSFENPNSKYSNHVIYNGPNNTVPETMIFNLTKLESYDGTSVDITTVDMYNEAVKTYFTDLFSYWVDPNSDGKFDDGVDGFRIDHMMDDLDWKGIRTNLFKNFWAPLFKHLKSINPNLKIFGEQANWKDIGENYFNTANVDMMFAFGLREGILSMEKEQISNKMDSLLKLTPKEKSQLVFLENHDTPRFASFVENDKAKLKLGAFLMMFNKGIPSIYYGQEIGMNGSGGFGKFGVTDGNDIPMREAFEWNAKIESTGSALWYKNTGPWWDKRSVLDDDGISVEEQKNDPNSLLNFYRKIIKIRKTHSEFIEGNQEIISNDNDNILAYIRKDGQNTMLVAVNTSDKEQKTSITLNTENPNFELNEVLLSDEKNEAVNNSSNVDLILNSHGYAIWQIK